MHPCFCLPCKHCFLHSLQPCFSFPCGQGLHFAQLSFRFPCGQRFLPITLGKDASPPVFFACQDVRS